MSLICAIAEVWIGLWRLPWRELHVSFCSLLVADRFSIGKELDFFLAVLFHCSLVLNLRRDARNWHALGEVIKLVDSIGFFLESVSFLTIEKFDLFSGKSTFLCMLQEIFLGLGSNFVFESWRNPKCPYLSCLCAFVLNDGSHAWEDYAIVAMWFSYTLRRLWWNSQGDCGGSIRQFRSTRVFTVFPKREDLHR